MALVNLALLAAALGTLLLLSRLIYSACFSPLAKIPAPHWSCHFAPFWLWRAKLSHQENTLIYQNHMAKGKALRLSPNLLSLNCFEGGSKDIYLKGMPKTPFYTLGFGFYGIQNLFTFEDNATHSARKRLISRQFSKSFILADSTSRESMKKIVYGRLLPIIDRAATSGKPLEVLELMYSYSMDSFITWQFGSSLSSNLLEDEKERRLYLDGFFAGAPYTFWQYEFPTLNRLFKAIGIIPKKVDSGYGDIEKWNLEKCDKAQALIAKAQGEENLPDADKPVIFAAALKALSDPHAPPGGDYPMRMELAADMFGHNSAAHETSGNTLTYAIYELSQRPHIQAKLREELLTLQPPLHFPPPPNKEDWILPSPSSVDKLPYLEAVIYESLRLYSSVPGGQPRMAPRSCSLGGYDNIPAGTVVQCSAYSLHRTPDIFPEPEEWKPERWIESSPEQLSDMRRWFWAFGSGGRMCIGSNFAYFSMKNVLGTIYTNYTTTLHDYGSMKLEDGYMGGPEGHRLEVNFHRID